MAEEKTIEDIESSEIDIIWRNVYNPNKNDIIEDHHLVIVIIHWLLLRNDFRCVGMEEREDMKSYENTLLLPNGWNSNDNSIVLCYKNMNNIYKLNFIKKEDQLHIIKGKQTTDVSIISLSDIIKSKTSKTSYALKQLLKDPHEFLNLMRREIIQNKITEESSIEDFKILENANKNDNELIVDSNRKEVPTSSKSYPDRRNNFIKDDEKYIFKGTNENGVPLGSKGQGSFNDLTQLEKPGLYLPTRPWDNEKGNYKPF